MQNSGPQNDPNKLVQQGLAALQNKQPSEAHKIFDNLIKQGIQNASIWLALAYACRDLGDGPGLLKAVDQSLEMGPKNPRAYILKGDYFYKDEDTRAAAAFYLKGINMAPPTAQTPPDLKPEIERATTRYNAIIKQFEDHLYTETCKGYDLEAPESKRVKNAIDFIVGKKQPFLQQPKKFYFPELPNVEFANPADFDWVNKLEALTDDIRKELLNVIKVNEGFNPYLKGSENRPENDGGGLKDNDDWSAYFIWEYGKKVEENAARCPTIVKFFEDYFATPEGKGSAPSVLFSKLSPHTRIPPHNGLFNTRYICHLPLIIPEKCGFRVGNDTREWEEGKVWIFDDSIEHEAWNESEEDRYILLFEVWKPELTSVERQMIDQIVSSVEEF